MHIILTISLWIALAINILGAFLNWREYRRLKRLNDKFEQEIKNILEKSFVHQAIKLYPSLEVIERYTQPLH